MPAQCNDGTVMQCRWCMGFMILVILTKIRSFTFCCNCGRTNSQIFDEDQPLKTLRISDKKQEEG